MQDAAGHANPRTTRRYDRARHSLDRHPSGAVEEFLGMDAVFAQVEAEHATVPAR